MKSADLVKIWNLTDVIQIDDTEVFHLLRKREKGFIHLHAGRVPVMAKSNKDNTVLFRQDGLVNLQQYL